MVLPYLRTKAFVIASTVELIHGAEIIKSPHLPALSENITKLTLPYFYYFSGVFHNRRHNPYFIFTSHLPHLEELSLRLHTAGLTTSAFGERLMIEIEQSDPERSKERKVIAAKDVIAKIEFNGLFACTALRRLRIEYIDCEMTAHFTKNGSVVELLREIQMFLINGFAALGRVVFVELVKVDAA